MAFGPDSREDQQCPSHWLCVLSAPRPEHRGLWMLPLGTSVNVGMVCSRESSEVVLDTNKRNGGQRGRVGCPAGTFQSTSSAAARGLCWVLFTPAGGAVRDGTW